MKTSTKAWIGAGAVAATFLTYKALTTTFAPPAGWWGGSATTIAPCPNTPPGPHPYLKWTNPLPQPSPIPPPGIFYFRFDGTTRPQASASNEGKLFTALGSDHTLGAQLDQMEIPLVSGLLGPDGLPIYVYAAPYRDIPELGHPEKTICAVYRQGNGSKAKPCPSGVTIAIYSTQISQAPQWTSGNGARQVEMNTYCNRTPTPGSTTPTVTLVPPTVPPACPTCAPTCGAATATATRTPTRTPTNCTTGPAKCPTRTKTPTPATGRFTLTPTP